MEPFANGAGFTPTAMMKHPLFTGLSLTVLALAGIASGQDAAAAAKPEKPNVIIILADDLGFSDLGCYGSEIETPNLDALAAGGVKFSQFYNSARCCPTRASLMTGLAPHQAGIGHMTEEPGAKFAADVPPAYQGHLNHDCTTLAEVMKSAGYTTLMTGKWHLGGADRGDWPLQRGFDQYYGCLAGAMFYFHPEGKRGITEGNEPVEELKSTTDLPYYTTDAFTDYAIRYTGQAVEEKKPFFLYLAYNAPHWPLQAHEKDIAKYLGKYQAGWDELRKQRYAKQLKLGLIDPKWALSPRDPEVPAWNSLKPEKQEEMGLRMATYAAMVDRLDQNVGRLVASLKERKVFDNTLIVFLADNGACAEGGTLGNYDMNNAADRDSKWDLAYGKAWANLSSTPFRLYKHFAQEGGSATPFFAHWPAGIKKQEGWFNSPGQIIDIMPTLAELAGATYPKEKDRHAILPLPGISLRPAFSGQPLERGKPMFMEHETNAFIREGDWKLEGRNIAMPNGVLAKRWQLFNMKDDRTELNNLAETMPDKVKAMAGEWRAWADAVHVYPKPGAKKAGPPAKADAEEKEEGE